MEVERTEFDVVAEFLTANGWPDPLLHEAVAELMRSARGGYPMDEIIQNARGVVYPNAAQQIPRG